MELWDCNLADILNQKKKKKEKFNFNEILEILMQLNNTFKILVKNKVIHRILKLENILLKRENGQNIWKLMDYGANNISEQDYLEVRTVDLYIAPEIISGEIYNNKCELWSLGIILYILYFQEVPYIGVINEAVLDKIRTKGKTLLKKSGNENFDDLISRLLEADPNKRISWEEYFKHPFFAQNFNKYDEINNNKEGKLGQSGYGNIYKAKDKSDQDYNKYYEINYFEGELGQSSYGIIYKAKDKRTGEMKAIKKVDITTIRNHWKHHTNEIRKINDNDLKPYFQGLYNEVNHMEILQGKNNENQNTVIFYEYFNIKESFAYVMELCDGNLLHYIMDKNLEIEDIKNILIQLNNSFKILHKNKILHRDIKAKNILYKKDNNSKIIFKLKLTDNCCLLKDSSKIEMSNIILNNNLRISAPEVLKGEKFKEESDLWSLGILIYLLKFKKYPFNGKDKDDILRQIRNEKLEKTNNKVFDDLVQKILTADSKKRMSWRTYFDHPFFK